MKESLYLVLLLTAFYSCKHKSSEQVFLADTLKNLNLKKYQKSDLTADFDLLASSLKEAHTGLYWYNTERQFDSIVKVQRKYINDSLNGLEFYNIVAPIISYSKEDHCDIYLPEDVSEFLKTKGKFIPISVLSVNEKIFVLNNPAKDIKIKGFELKKINGKRIEDIYRELFKTFASDGYIKQSKYRWLDNMRFSEYYAQTIGQPNEYKMEVLDPKSGQILTFELSPVNSDSLSKINNEVNLYQDLEPADFKIISDNTVILTFNTFHDVLYEEKEIEFKTLVSNAFNKIDSLNIKNLIIDIRENGGGTEGNEDYLFSYLTDKAYKKYKNVKISAFQYSFYEHTDTNTEKAIEEFEKDIEKEHYLTEDGRILRKDGIEEVEPLKPNPFKGEIYVLISGWTYSGGAEFASLMRQHTDAIFIGEETGGGFYGNTSGYGLGLTLPNTKIEVDIPLLKFSLNVDKGEFGRGVIPDYPIQPTFGNYKNGIDPVMDLVKKMAE